jgi:CBS domain-containing protein
MNVGEICSRDLVSAPESAPLGEIAALMCQRHVGAIVVTKIPSERPIAAGIVTDRDIVLAQLGRAADFASLRAADVMSACPLELCEDDSVEDAIQRMRARGVRRAVVITADGALAGVVSTDDLVVQIARELIVLACVLDRQPERVSHGRPDSRM